MPGRSGSGATAGRGWRAGAPGPPRSAGVGCAASARNRPAPGRHDRPPRPRRRSHKKAAACGDPAGHASADPTPASSHPGPHARPRAAGACGQAARRQAGRTCSEYGPCPPERYAIQRHAKAPRRWWRPETAGSRCGARRARTAGALSSGWPDWACRPGMRHRSDRPSSRARPGCRCGASGGRDCHTRPGGRSDAGQSRAAESSVFWPSPRARASAGNSWVRLSAAVL